MLHSLKKHAFRLQVPLDAALAPDSESAHLRHQLRHMRQQLEHLLHVHHASGAIWLRLLHNQRNFSERMHSAYPNDDALSLICADLRSETARLSSQFAREQRAVSPLLAHIREQIGWYVTQIRNVEGMYSGLDALHGEYNRYKRKVDDLVTRTDEHRFSARRVPDKSRKSRNFSKLDRAEEQHKRMLQEVLREQRKLFGVHAALFHAALVAFWLSHASCVDALVDSLKQARQFAEAEQEHMQRLDVRQLVDEVDGDAAVSVHVGVTQVAVEAARVQTDEQQLASRSCSSTHTAAHAGVGTSVDVHEVHHLISKASLDVDEKARNEKARNEWLSRTGEQQQQ